MIRSRRRAGRAERRRDRGLSGTRRRVIATGIGTANRYGETAIHDEAIAPRAHGAPPAPEIREPAVRFAKLMRATAGEDTFCTMDPDRFGDLDLRPHEMLAGRHAAEIGRLENELAAVAEQANVHETSLYDAERALKEALAVSPDRRDAHQSAQIPRLVDAVNERRERFAASARAVHRVLHLCGDRTLALAALMRGPGGRSLSAPYRRSDPTRAAVPARALPSAGPSRSTVACLGVLGGAAVGAGAVVLLRPARKTKDGIRS